MPLPTTIVTPAGGWDFRASRMPPIKSSGGNFYVICGASDLDDGVDAFKAADPTAGWTEQDAANAPVLGGSGNNCLIVEPSPETADKIHVVALSGVHEAFYSRFDMATDAWDDISGGSRAVKIATLDGAAGGGEFLGGIVERSNTDLVALMAQGDKVMGVRYMKPQYAKSTDDGATWGSLVNVFGSIADEINRYGAAIALGTGDTVHFFTAEDNGDGTADVVTRAMSAADVLQTERDTGVDCDTEADPGDNPANTYFTHAIAFARGGATKIRLGYRAATTLNLAVLEFDAAADPSAFASSDVDAAVDVAFEDTDDDARTVCASLVYAPDADKVYAMLTDAADDDIKYAHDQGADSYTSVITAKAGAHSLVFANAYTRDSTLTLAYVYFDAGAYKYDEIDISGDVPAGGGTLFLRTVPL